MSTARKVLRLAGLWSLLGALFATQAFIGSHYSTIPLSWAESFGVAFIAWYVRGLLAIPAFWLATRFEDHSVAHSPFATCVAARAGVLT